MKLARKIIYLTLAITFTGQNILSASFVARHAVKISGTATSLCTAKLLHTTVKNWRQGNRIPYRSRNYQLNTLAIAGGACLTCWFNQKNTAPKVTATANGPAAPTDVVPEGFPTPAEIQAHVNTEQYPFHRAARTGNLALVRHVLAHMDINRQRGIRNFTLFHDVVRHEDLHYTLPLLLARLETNINAQTLYGNTALHMAINLGNRENNYNLPVIKVLLALPNIHINIQNSDGETPLLRAVLWEKLDIIKLLLQQGADTSLSNNNGLSVISIIKNLHIKGAQRTARENAILAIFEEHRRTVVAAVAGNIVQPIPGTVAGLVADYLGHTDPNQKEDPTVTAPGAPPADQE